MKSKNSKSKDSKESPKKTSQKDSKQKSKKEKEEEKSEEEEKILIPKPQNIERFIYITQYSDSSILMSNLKLLFEEINQKAFNFPSSREIYTYNLSQEEQDNNNIDYISGFQLTDKNIRITILEGITDKAMQRVKEVLPKIKLNDEKIKILNNSQILFNTRIYSKFNLSLKIIKLRYHLNKYLETFAIYENANRFRQIYDCFQNLASILRVETFEEINTYNIFPTAESLFLMERKHGDMITYQDMTGIYQERKKVKRINMRYIFNDKNTNNTSYSNINSNNEKEKKDNKKNNNKKKNIYISKSQSDINSDNYKKKKKLEEEVASYREKLKNIHKLILKPKTVCRNELYEKFLEEKKNKHVSKSQIWDNNIKYIEKLKKEIPTYKKFCQPCKPGEEIIETPNQILFCPTKRNYFDALVKKMREKYIKDKKHHYSYSNYSLRLSFPMIETGRNEEYIKYLENKKKWRNNKDFERYKQPEKEKYFFPKINNIL